MFVAQHKKTWPIDLMCRLLGVTRGGYYGYQQRHGDEEDDRYHQELLEAVRDIAKASDYSYGSRRMKKALNILSVWVESPKGTSPSGSHRSVRESLDSYGSSYPSPHE